MEGEQLELFPELIQKWEEDLRWAHIIKEREEKLDEDGACYLCNAQTAIESVYGHGVNAGIARWGWLKGRESVRKEVLE